MDAPPIDPPSPAADGPGPDTPTSGPDPVARRLRRRVDGRLLGGVAGGLADFLGVDVLLVRLGFVVTGFFGGLGVLAYVFGWIVVPASSPSESAAARPGDRKQLLGYGLVALGLLAIGGRFGWTFHADGAFWPLALIAMGAAVLWLRTRDVFQEHPAGPPAAVQVAHSVPSPESTAEMPPPAAPSAAPNFSTPTVQTPTVAVPNAKRPRPRSYLGALTWSGLLVLAGVAWILDASGAVAINVGVVLAVALALVGIALVLSAWFGRARGLIALGLPLVLVVGSLSVLEVPLDGGIGESTYHPRTVAALHHEYELGIGDLSVDLRDLDFSGSHRRIHAQLGIGQLNVTVPKGVRVVLDGHVRAGSITAFEREHHSCCPSRLHVVRHGRAGAGTVIVDADIGAGNLHVVQAEESLRAAS